MSPPPPDERAQNLRDERRYRMLLQHAYEFQPSCECFPSSPKFIVLTLGGDAPALEAVDEPSAKALVDALIADIHETPQEVARPRLTDLGADRCCCKEGPRQAA